MSKFFHTCLVCKPKVEFGKISLGYVWFPKSTKERKKMLKKMIFSCLIVL